MGLFKTLFGDAAEKPQKSYKDAKKLWWVDDLELLYDGNKYALKYTGSKGTTTKYIYDDVDLLNENQARLVQKQADGSLKYGVASTCSDFIYTDCEYTRVDFLDGSKAVFAIDEDGDEYAINRWGQIYALDVYRDIVINK